METRVATKKGTTMFTTPEALESHGLEEISQKTDICGCGVLIFYISYLRHPFYHPNPVEMNIKIRAGKFIKYETALIIYNY